MELSTVLVTVVLAAGFETATGASATLGGFGILGTVAGVAGTTVEGAIGGVAVVAGAGGIDGVAVGIACAGWARITGAFCVFAGVAIGWRAAAVLPAIAVLAGFAIRVPRLSGVLVRPSAVVIPALFPNPVMIICAPYPTIAGANLATVW